MPTNLKKYFTLTPLFILALVTNVISCDCGKNGDNQEGNTGMLTMEVTPRQLDPTKPATTATFHLTEPDKKADLAKFQLKAHLTKQEGGTGKLKYKDATGNDQEAGKIDAPLTHFTSLTSLENNNAPLKIDFTVLAEDKVTLLVYQIQAFDADNNSIGSFEVTYQAKKNQKLATLKLESKEQLEGDQKEIKLELHNPNSETLAAGTIKLQVKRTQGKDAIILGSMPTATPDMYELAINEEILPTQSLHKTFLIDSQTDAKATFEIQLIQGATPGNIIPVTWEKGAQLELTVKHEGDPRQLTYSIINSGTKEIKHAKLQYSCETAGIQLAGRALTKDEPQTLPVGDLAVNKKIANQVLGAINFGSKTDANFVFKVIYDGGSSEEKKIVCTAADVQLSIEGLTYDVATNQISYSIRNAGQDKADGVQIRYTNEGPDEAGKKVTINNQTTATTAPVNILKTATSAPVNLPIDFKQADEATFKFELLYNGIVMSQTKKTFQAKVVKLKLVAANGTSSPIMLTDGNLTFKCKILSEVDGRPLTEIDPTQVQINIKDNKGNTNSFISQINGAASGINHLTGPDLGTLGKEITLHLHPTTEKEAAFSLALSYKNTPQGTPLTISWKEEAIEIQDLYPFVGNNEASFSLYSSVIAIVPDQLTIELTSNNHATFTLIKEDDSDGGASLTLDQLIGAAETPVHIKTDSIRFKLATNPDNEGSSQVTIHIKHGTKELASQTVIWKAQGTSLRTTTTDFFQQFRDQAPYKLQVENMGNEVDTDKIIFRFLNDKNVNFKIGNWSTKATGDTNLKNIINKGRLAVNEKIEFDIQQDRTTIPDLYGADITIELLDATGISLSKQDLTWLNQVKIDTELKPLFDQLQNSEKEFKNHQEQFNNQKATNWLVTFKAIQAMIQLKSDLDGWLIKLSNLDFNKMHKALRQFSEEQLKNKNKLNEKIHQQIIIGLKYTKSGVTYFSKKAKNTIQTLKSSTGPQDQAIKKLEKKLLHMQECLNDMATLANQYNTKEAQQILQEAQEIATETAQAARKAKEKAKPKTTPITQEMIAYANYEMINVGEVLRKLKASEQVDVNQRKTSGSHGVTALHETVKHIVGKNSSSGQDLEQVKAIINVLLDHGADITIAASSNSPLYEPENVLEELVKNITAKNPSAYSPVIFKFLLDEIIKRNLQALNKTYYTTFQINQKNKKEYTLLHMAVMATGQGENLAQEIEALIQKGTPVNRKDAAGDTPLHLAAGNGNKAIVKLLLDKGADSKEMNKVLEIPLHVAVVANKIDIVEILLEGIDQKSLEAQINFPNANGETSLHLAAKLGHEAIIKLLLTKGANKYAIDNQGNTPYAVKKMGLSTEIQNQLKP